MPCCKCIWHGTARLITAWLPHGCGRVCHDGTLHAWHGSALHIEDLNHVSNCAQHANLTALPLLCPARCLLPQTRRAWQPAGAPTPWSPAATASWLACCQRAPASLPTCRTAVRATRC